MLLESIHSIESIKYHCINIPPWYQTIHKKETRWKSFSIGCWKTQENVDQLTEVVNWENTSQGNWGANSVSDGWLIHSKRITN